MKVEDLSQYLNELIAESEENKKDIEAQQKYLATIVNNIGEGLMVVRSDKTVELFNPMAESLSGYDVDQVLEKPVDSCVRFYDSKTHSEYRDFISQGLISKQSEHIFENISLRNKAGEFIPVSVVTSPVQGKGLKNGGSIILFHDVTKQAEFDRMRDEFISIASHELRTPMTIINGYSGLLLDTDAGIMTENQKSYIKKIKRNTQQLIQLVNDMLYVSKCESGKIALDLGDFNIGALVGDIGEEFQELFEQKGVLLKVENFHKMIHSDAGKIRQILVNLIGNASKFTEKGGSVRVICTERDTNIEIQVQDTGQGISGENIKKLFERFSQVHTQVLENNEGTGLGLVICKLLIETLGGEIFVTSTVGNGSTFSIIFPKQTQELL